jgi:nucleotide-binding universal stress UspA family protein/quercetin dioxygenase-like cupin family protein
MPSIQTILHPTDFSDNSQCAFEMACALARDSHATLLVLHVAMPSASPLFAAPPPDPSRPIESQRSDMHLPWPQPADPGIRVEHRLAEGEPAEEILRLAGAQTCDLIVIGSHGRTGLERLLTGSVAEEVLRKGVCPVMVIKNPFCPKPPARTEATANPGDPVDVRPLGTSLASAQTRTLIRTAGLEVVRLVVRAGQEIPEHSSQGEIIVHCLEGRVTFTALGKSQVLEAGKLLDLPAGEPHTLKGIEDASLLLTIVVPRQ